MGILKFEIYNDTVKKLLPAFLESLFSLSTGLTGFYDGYDLHIYSDLNRRVVGYLHISSEILENSVGEEFGFEILDRTLTGLLKKMFEPTIKSGYPVKFDFEEENLVFSTEYPYEKKSRVPISIYKKDTDEYKTVAEKVKIFYEPSEHILSYAPVISEVPVKYGDPVFETLNDLLKYKPEICYRTEAEYALIIAKDGYIYGAIGCRTWVPLVDDYINVKEYESARYVFSPPPKQLTYKLDRYVVENVRNALRPLKKKELLELIDYSFNRLKDRPFIIIKMKATGLTYQLFINIEGEDVEWLKPSREYEYVTKIEPLYRDALKVLSDEQIKELEEYIKTVYKDVKYEKITVDEAVGKVKEKISELRGVAKPPAKPLAETIREKLEDIKKRMDELSEEYNIIITEHDRASEVFRRLEEKPIETEIRDLKRGLKTLMDRISPLKDKYVEISDELRKLYEEASEVEPSDVRISLMHNINTTLSLVDGYIKNLNFIMDRLKYMESRLEEILKKIKPPIEEEIKRYAVEIAVEEGLSRKDAEELIKELWNDIKIAIKDKTLEEAKKIVEEMVRPEARRRAVAPPPKAPPRRPVPVEELPIALSSEDLSYLITFGVPKFIMDKGGVYGLTLGLEPMVQLAMMEYLSDKFRRYEAKTGVEWFAVNWFIRIRHIVMRRGIDDALKHYWSGILSELRRYLIDYGLPSYDEIKITIYNTKTGKTYEYGFGRLWIEAMKYYIYYIAGVEITHIPEDARTAVKIISDWRREGYPREKVITV